MKFICRFFPVTLLVFAGCMTSSYVAPDTSVIPSENYSRVIDKPFDQTWSALMQFAGSAYFDIQQFEKQSGLLILSFVGSIPGEFITGGHFKTEGVWYFNGDFVDFCVKYRGGYLEDRVNVIVSPVDSNRTRVTVRAHYTFSYGNPEIGIQSWSFDSGTADSHAVSSLGTGPGEMITLRPTYKAEKSILDAVESAN
jgi:hypothetical protein